MNISEKNTFAPADLLLQNIGSKIVTTLHIYNTDDGRWASNA